MPSGLPRNDTKKSKQASKLEPNIQTFIAKFLRTDSIRSKSDAIRRLKTIIAKCADCEFEPDNVDSCYKHITGEANTPCFELMLFLCQSYWFCHESYDSDKVRGWMHNELGLRKMSTTIDLAF